MVGQNIQMFRSMTLFNDAGLTGSSENCKRDTVRNLYLTQKNRGWSFFKVSMHVAAPETQNNTPNSRKVCHNMGPLNSTYSYLCLYSILTRHVTLTHKSQQNLNSCFDAKQ